jgi:hypothetical protein
MRIIAFPIITCILTSGCAAVIPNSSDRTPPSLTFTIYHSSPVIDSRNTGAYTVSGPVNITDRCVYVKNPFRVGVTAVDSGGIREIRIGTIYTAGPEATESEGDIIARNIPDQHIQFVNVDGSVSTFSNPGKSPSSGEVIVIYENSRAYDTAWLSAVYEFPNGVTRGLFKADAYNFRVDVGRNRQAGRTQISGYEVRLAGPDDMAGSSCR